MISSKKVICIIPARLASSRFPKKVLSNLHGKPLLQWVWEAASRVRIFDQLAFAVDDKKTAELVSSFGAMCYMTSPHCPSGSDRIAEVLLNEKIDGDIWVNWQGDEPFITEKMIETLLSNCEEEDDIWTLKKKSAILKRFSLPMWQKSSVMLKVMLFIFLVV